MGDPVEVRALLLPRKVSELAPEVEAFKSFKTEFKHKEASRVMSVAFCPSAPHRLAVVSGTKVSVWTSKEGKLELHSSISKFKDIAQCVAWRSDGRLMLAGEASGSCAVIESETRKVLRRFRGHGDAVTCASFATADKSRAATGSRDGKLRIWDVATSELLQTVDAHSDNMKALAPGPSGPDSWISAGYDGIVKLWDLRMGGSSTADSKNEASCVASCDHGHPIEAGVSYPGAALYATAGGPVVKVWDLAGGGRLVQEIPDAHSKAVTAICLDSTASVLLTASFDGLAKAFHAASLQHMWTYRLSGPATCAAWRPDDKAFVVGLDDGSWQLRVSQAATAAKAKAAALTAQPKRPLKYREGRLRGGDHQPDEDDEVVEASAKKRRSDRESHIEFLLRKFEYRKIAEFMIMPECGAGLSLALVEELLQRGSLATALTEIGEELCLAALRWLLKAFSSVDSLRMHLFYEALHTLLDNNRCLSPPSTPVLIHAVEQIDLKVSQEMRIQEVLNETAGMVDTIISS